METRSMVETTAEAPPPAVPAPHRSPSVDNIVRAGWAFRVPLLAIADITGLHRREVMAIVRRLGLPDRCPATLGMIAGSAVDGTVDENRGPSEM